MRNKERIKASEVSTIVHANIGKRLLAAIIDALFFSFVAIGLALWVFLPIANAGLHYEENQTIATQYRVASHLYVYRQANDDNVYVPIEVKDYTEKLNPSKSSSINPIYGFTDVEYTYYLEHLYYYYHSYLTNVDVELPNPTETKTYDPVKDLFVSPHYNDLIEGVLPKDYYTDEWFVSNALDFKDGVSSYFNYDSTKSSILEKVTIKEGVMVDTIVKFLKKACYDATAHLNYSDYYVELTNLIKWAQVVEVVPAIILSYSVFYILIPLLYKNGETLAKKFLKIAVISSNGFQVKKPQILFREVLMFSILLFSALIVGIGLTSLATLGFAIVLLLIATLISKEHRSPMDYAALTLVVDTPKSVWFNSPEEEKKFAQELDDKMAKYKNKKIIEKNVIQVGSTIIDEDVKKEFIESQKNDAKDE